MYAGNVIAFYVPIVKYRCRFYIRMYVHVSVFRRRDYLIWRGAIYFASRRVVSDLPDTLSETREKTEPLRPELDVASGRRHFPIGYDG